MIKTESKTGLFDKLYAAAAGVYDEVKKPLVKNKIKRRLQAAYDDAESRINEGNIQIQKTREDFEKYDVNIVLNYKAGIAKSRELQNEIKDEYLELFGKQMPISEED